MRVNTRAKTNPPASAESRRGILRRREACRPGARRKVAPTERLREHDCMPAGLAARASSRSAWARAIGRAARRTGSSFKNPATPVRRRQKRIGAVEYPKLASDTCIRDCGLYERFAHTVRVG